jgi:ATP-binding cassette subfamily C protein CydD
MEHYGLAQVSRWLLAILGIVLLRAVLIVLSEGLAGRLAVRIKNRLRSSLLEKIDRLGSEALKNESTGELTTAALQGADALDAYYSQYLPQVIVAALVPLIILVVVFPLDVLTGVVFVLTAPLIPLFMMLIGWMVEALTRKQWLALTRLGSYFLDTLQGIATLKHLGRSKDRAQDVRWVSDQYRDVTLNVLRVTFLTALVLELVATISTAVVAVEIGLRLLYYRLDFQQAFFILLIAPEFYLPLRNLSARYHAAMTGVTAAQRIYQLLDLPEPEKKSGSSTRQPGWQKISEFTISLKDVSHTYAGIVEPALVNINLGIESGKHYALIGRSGSGKTTLARILLRYIEPLEGRVLLNGEDINRWSKSAWREFVGWLPQNPHIFNATLLENITLGRDGYTDQRIEAALHYSGLQQLVNALPAGVNTPMLEGGQRFSGGELQRIVLARIYVRNPDFLILDEPTAHFDPELAQFLSAGIKQLMQGRTTLTIAHRLSTIVDMDGIFFLDKGRLVAQGTHQQLLQDSLAYRAFINPRESGS